MRPGGANIRQLATVCTITRAPHFPTKASVELYIKLVGPIYRKVFIDCLSTGATSPLEASPRTKNTFHHRLVEFPQAAGLSHREFSVQILRAGQILRARQRHLSCCAAKIQIPQEQLSNAGTPTCPISPTLRLKVCIRSFDELGVLCVFSTANSSFQMAGSARSLTCGPVKL